MMRKLFSGAVLPPPLYFLPPQHRGGRAGFPEQAGDGDRAARPVVLPMP